MSGLLDFFSSEAGQRRRAALNEFGRDVGYYVPPELRDLLGFAAEMSPTATVDRAATASMRAADPSRTTSQRIGDVGNMLSEVAGVVGPAAVANRAAMPTAQALQEGMMGFSMGAQDLGRTVVDRLNQPGPVPTMYSNPIMGAPDTSYRISHQPTGPGDENAIRLDDLTRSITGEVAGYPEDFYSPRGPQYYAPPPSFTGDEFGLANQQSYRAIQAVRNNPDAEVTIYRAVPNDENITEINPGDWITLSPKYAELHAAGGYGPRGEGAGKVISQTVKVRDIFWGGDDVNEFGFFPSQPQTPAQRVAGLLSSNRADEVTDEMMAAVDPQEMFRLYEVGATGADMPMDVASRMARAGEMGFDTGAYHGTGVDFPEFDGRSYAASGFGTHMGAPEAADQILRNRQSRLARARGAPDYVDNSAVLPLRASAQGAIRIADTNTWNPHDVMSAMAWSDDPLAAAAYDRIVSDPDYPRFASESELEAFMQQRMENDGVSGFVYQNEIEGGGDSYAIFDPRNIRSRFARFDPRLSHLANLSAGIGGLGLLGYTAMQPQEEQY